MGKVKPISIKLLDFIDWYREAKDLGFIQSRAAVPVFEAKHDVHVAVIWSNACTRNISQVTKSEAQKK